LARSHTKKGPGRTHGQCTLIVDPTDGKHLGVRAPVRRHAMAAFGGNWQGQEYLSYREHDMLTRLTDSRWMEGPNRVTDGPMNRRAAMAHIKSLRR